jgi:hypothetical protein
MKKLYTFLFIAFIGFIGSAQSVDIIYPYSSICTSSMPVNVVISGTGNYLGGTFSSTPGLLIDSSTGTIIPTASAPGAYLVTYSVPAGPPDWIAMSASTFVEIVPTAVPYFDAIAPICSGGNPPALPNISNNGITGTWSPSTVSDSVSGIYTFTPEASECAMSTTMNIDVFLPYVPVITTASGLNTLYVDENNQVVASLELISGQPEGYTYQWSENTSFITSATDSNYVVDTASPTGTTRFYRVWVTHIETGCHTVSGIFPVFQSNGVPPPATDRFQTLAAGSTLTNVVISGTDIKWYGTATDKNLMSVPLPLSTVLVDGMTYYATQTVNGVESLERVPVTVYLTLGGVETELVSVTYSPNPVRDNLSIKFAKIIDTVSIINALGQVVTTAIYNQSEIVIDMNDFRAGTYFVRVTSADKTKVLKVVKD